MTFNCGARTHGGGTGSRRLSRLDRRLISCWQTFTRRRLLWVRIFSTVCLAGGMAAAMEAVIMEAATETGTAEGPIVVRLGAISRIRTGINRRRPRNSGCLCVPAVALTTRRTAVFAPIVASASDRPRRRVRSAMRQFQPTLNFAALAVRRWPEQILRKSEACLRADIRSVNMLG